MVDHDAVPDALALGWSPFVGGRGCDSSSQSVRHAAMFEFAALSKWYASKQAGRFDTGRGDLETPLYLVLLRDRSQTSVPSFRTYILRKRCLYRWQLHVVCSIDVVTCWGISLPRLSPLIAVCVMTYSSLVFQRSGVRGQTHNNNLPGTVSTPSAPQRRSCSPEISLIRPEAISKS